MAAFELPWTMTNPDLGWSVDTGPLLPTFNLPSAGTTNKDLITGHLVKYINDNTGTFDTTLGKGVKGWVNNYINKWGSDKYNLLNAGISAGADLAGNLINSNGLSTTAGNIMSGIGNIAGNIPGPIGWAGKGLALLGLGVNALWGHKFNDANVAAAEKAVADRNNWLFGDYSNTASLLAGSLANKQLGNVSKSYLGKEGPFSHAVTDKMNEINNATLNANARANNSELLAYANYLNNLVRNAISNDMLGNITACGGPLNIRFNNRFEKGGNVNTSLTHGGLFSNGLVQINNGGSHELNPNQGVQYGVDQQGIPNLVEEGETIFNAGAYGGPDSYSFSDRIRFPMKEYGNMFALGGITKRKKGKRSKNYTFAEISKLLSKESEERPNDNKSLKTLAKNLGRLANIQEEVKARDMINLMNPMDVMMALLQSPMGELLSMASLNIDQQQEQPIMAACGGKLFSNGGNIFGPVNLFAKAGGIKTRRRTNNTLTVNGLEVYELPETMVLHDPLFRTAISELIKDRKSSYDKLVKEKKYSEAYDLVKNLQSDISGIQIGYYQAMLNPTSDNVLALQERFNNLGLNKNVNAVLSEKTKDKNGKNAYPVYQKGKPFLSDNPLDSINGVVTQNRYIDFDNYDKALLREMGLNISDLQTAINNYGIDTWNSDFPTLNYSSDTPDYLKSLAMLSIGDLNTNKVVLNPAYAKDNTLPLYMSLDDYIRLYETPEGEDSTTWWDNLADVDKQKIYAKYGTVGDPTRTGVYELQQIYSLLNSAKEAQKQALQNSSNDVINEDNFYLKPLDLNDWETWASLGIHLGDYLDSMFGSGRKYQAPGLDAAYDYLSRVGNIPVVRSNPVGTKAVFNPENVNYNLGNITNEESGLIRTLQNMNAGSNGANVANSLASMNTAMKQQGEYRNQARERNFKNLQDVLLINNGLDLLNVQNSLSAQTANALNAARAREIQATGAAGIMNSMAQSYANWLKQRSDASSGLASLLYNLGYNKQTENQARRQFAIYNQQPDVWDALGIPYRRVKNPIR